MNLEFWIEFQWQTGSTGCFKTFKFLFQSPGESKKKKKNKNTNTLGQFLSSSLYSTNYNLLCIYLIFFIK